MVDDRKPHVVSISDMFVSSDPYEIMITHALGSCIAVIVHDQVRECGGMLHFMLPNSNISPGKSQRTPAMFADTGISQLFASMKALGCKNEDMSVKIAGGSKTLCDNGFFGIGEKNQEAAREYIARHGLSICSEDVGGGDARTVRFYVGPGRVFVKRTKKLTGEEMRAIMGRSSER